MTIEPLTLEETSGELKETLEAVKTKVGMLPNLYAVMAKAPSVLKNALGASENLGQSALGAQIGEQIAIAVANENGCGYCLSAHTAIGKMVGVSDVDLDSAQFAEASDPKAQAAIDLALELNAHHGYGPNTQGVVQKAYDAGLSEQEVLEVIGYVGMNILTNMTNGVAKTPIDFPEVQVKEAA